MGVEANSSSRSGLGYASGSLTTFDPGDCFRCCTEQRDRLGDLQDLTEAELAIINKVNPTTPDAVSWSTDLSGGVQRVAMMHGCVPYGNAKARMNAFGLPDPIPVHREPIYTPRVELVSKYPTLPDAKQFRLPNIGFSVQKAAIDKGKATVADNTVENTADGSVWSTKGKARQSSTIQCGRRSRAGADIRGR